MKLLKGKLSVLLLSTLLSVSSVSSMASDTGYDVIIRSANQGEAKAQLALGYMYNLGKGVPQDKHKAFEWFQKAANQGYAEAQYTLGVLYYKSEGVRQDYHKAFEWFQKAANQGHAKAQAMIAVMYHEGEGVRQDKYKSKEWAGKACDNGYQLGCDAYRELNQHGFLQ